MEKTLSIKIDDKGELKGTVGWLLSVADHVKVGKTKAGNQAAWLRDRADKSICTLAVRGWWEDGVNVTIIDRYDGRPTDELCMDFACSDACFERICEIAEEIKDVMDEIWEADGKEVLSVVRGHSKSLHNTGSKKICVSLTMLEVIFLGARATGRLFSSPSPCKPAPIINHARSLFKTPAPATRHSPPDRVFVRFVLIVQFERMALPALNCSSVKFPPNRVFTSDTRMIPALDVKPDNGSAG